MMYLILKHTPYEYIKDSFDIVSTTNNLDEANNRLQGYQLIDEDKSVSYSILKYEKCNHRKLAVVHSKTP